MMLAGLSRSDHAGAPAYRTIPSHTPPQDTNAMQLLTSAGSPYVRKARILIRERGLTDQVTEVPTKALADGDAHLAANPLGKIPALILDDGTTLVDSPVVCEYLDTLGTAGSPVFPASGAARWGALSLQALGDGICDSAVLLRLEGQRPQAHHSPLWTQRWTASIERTCAKLNGDIGLLGGDLSIGQIAVAVALDYVDFRHPDFGWASRYPMLSAWVKALSGRASFEATAPSD